MFHLRFFRGNLPLRIFSSHKSGASLIEILLAVAFLTIVGGFLMNWVGSNRKQNQGFTDKNAARQRAGIKLYQLMDLPFTHSDLSVGAHDDGSTNGAMTWQVEYLDGDTKLKKVVIREFGRNKQNKANNAVYVDIVGFKYADF